MISQTLGTDYDITFCYLEEDDWIKYVRLGGPRIGVE